MAEGLVTRLGFILHGPWRVLNRETCFERIPLVEKGLKEARVEAGNQWEGYAADRASNDGSLGVEVWASML